MKNLTDPPDHAPQKDGPDIESIGRIVEALQYLGAEAARAGADEIQVVIESAHKICLTAQYLFIREYLEQKLACDNLAIEGNASTKKN